ncbi:MAG: TonB-dependent receptor [Acidobacteria bacterium]|nr:TonB-dependent receptor [Acidobacteriota bacterium]
MGKILSILLCALLVCAQLAMSQATTGTISGVVTDSSGGVLPGATLTILNEDTGIARTAQSDAQGHYLAPLLALGRYKVTVSVEGFQTEIRSGIVLTVGREAVVNLALSVGAVSQTVEVSGEAPLVESTTSSVGGLVDERTIRELPLNGRSYDQLALLEAGVTSYGGGATSGGFLYGTGTRFSVAGSRSYNNSYLLDGMDINDSGNGTPGGAAGTNLGVDAIREFKIVTSLFSAETGRATGAVISAVTKSGANDYHGNLFHFIRNSAMDARNFFDVRNAPNPTPVPAFKRNQFGGTVGGPIKRDRTFYFGAYEGMRERLATTQIATVPSVTAKNGTLAGGRVVAVSPAIRPFLVLWPDPNGRDFGDGTAEFITSPSRPTNQDYFMVRVDHQLTSKHSLFGRYTFDDDSRRALTNVATSEDTSDARRQYVTLQLSSVLSSNLLNSARFGINRSISLTDNLPTSAIPDGLSFIPGQPIGVIGIGGRAAGAALIIANAGTSDTAPRFAYYSVFEAADDVTFIRGRHSWKFGGNLKGMRDNTAQNTSLRGIYRFDSFETVLTATPNNFGAVRPGQSAYRGFRQKLFALFAQDDFRMNSRLTLNLGFRWEAVSDPSESNNLASRLMNVSDRAFTQDDVFMEITSKNFEPRVGFAWQANGSGKTVLRGGFGIFHDQILPVYYAVAVTKYPPFYERLAVAPTVAQPLRFPDAYTQLAGSGLVAINGVAPFLKTPSKNHYTLTLQQQIFEDMVLEVGYVGSKGTNVPRYAELNTRAYQLVNGQKTFTAGAPRMNPFFDEIRPLLTDTNAHYDGMQVKFKRASSRNLQFQISYTYSKALDSASTVATADNSREAQASLDPEDPARDKARASFDATNNLVINVGYPLPVAFDNKIASTVLGGWEFSGIATFTDGQPFSARLGFDRALNLGGGRADRPDLKAGSSQNSVFENPTADRWYDPSAFTLPTAGTYGNLGRNTLVGPGRQTIDLSLVKRFTLSESADFQVRTELFNILNRANFGLPQNVPLTNTGAISASAGRITDTVTTSRQIQIGMKLTF